MTKPKTLYFVGHELTSPTDHLGEVTEERANEMFDKIMDAMGLTDLKNLANDITYAYQLANFIYFNPNSQLDNRRELQLCRSRIALLLAKLGNDNRISGAMLTRN